MSVVKAILWDVGGTLVDDRCTMAENIRGRLALVGVDLDFLSNVDIETAFGRFFQLEPSWLTVEQERRDAENFMRELLAPAHLGGAQLNEVLANLRPYYDVHRPVPGIPELLADLRARGLKQAVVSNWPPSLKGFLDHHDLTRYFDLLVFSGQDGIKKPDPRIYRRVTDGLGVTAPECVFVGDHLSLDIVPTRKLGMQAIHFDPRHKHPVADAFTVPELRTLLLAML